VLDCTSFKPFQVLEFTVEFDGDPGEQLKKWIVVLNDVHRQALVCFKPTTKVQRYQDEPVLLEGAIEYQAGELKFFPKRTIVPVTPMPIPYASLRKCHVSTKIEPLGEMPEDFRERVLTAILNRADWNNAKKRTVLTTLGFGDDCL
jgi:hypothetical protein